MGMIPISLQRMATNWVATRILQLNTGMNYFPDQFLVGGELQHFLKQGQTYEYAYLQLVWRHVKPYSYFLISYNIQKSQEKK